MACQDQEDNQGFQESLEEMALLVILVMLGHGEKLDHLDQRETLVDLVLTTLAQEDHRVTKERRETVDLVVAEVTAVRKVNQEIKELLESRVSQDLQVNLVPEEQEERLDRMEFLDLREIPASPNVMS